MARKIRNRLITHRIVFGIFSLIIISAPFVEMDYKRRKIMAV
jgi:hypothetical protein